MPPLTEKELESALRVAGRPRGSTAARLRLDPADIERYRASGFSYRQIGKIFGVSRTTILRSIGRNI